MASRPRARRRARAASGSLPGKCARGTHEAPRFCFHTDPIAVDPKAAHELVGWYRTAAGADGCAGAYVPGMGSLSLPPSENWRRFQRRFPPSGGESTRVYLGAYAEGEVWYDAVALRRVGDAANLLTNPSFEEGTTIPHEELVRRYRLDALAHRASTANVARPTVRVAADGQGASIDWTEFDREVQFYLDHGQNAFNVSWCQLRGGWGKVTQADPAKDVLRRELLRRTQLHLERKGWLDLAYIYAIDEPGFQAFGDVRQAFELVHDAAPRLKRPAHLRLRGHPAPGGPGAEGLPAYAQLARRGGRVRAPTRTASIPSSSTRSAAGQQGDLGLRLHLGRPSLPEHVGHRQPRLGTPHPLLAVLPGARRGLPLLGRSPIGPRAPGTTR